MKTTGTTITLFLPLLVTTLALAPGVAAQKGPEGWKIAHGHNVVIDEDAAKNDPVKNPRK